MRIYSILRTGWFLFIRGAVDESGEQFVAYFLPTDETLGKRKRDSEDGVDYAPDEEWVTSDGSQVIMHTVTLLTMSYE